MGGEEEVRVGWVSGGRGGGKKRWSWKFGREVVEGAKGIGVWWRLVILRLCFRWLLLLV